MKVYVLRYDHLNKVEDKFFSTSYEKVKKKMHEIAESFRNHKELFEVDEGSLSENCTTIQYLFGGREKDYYTIEIISVEN